MAIKYTFIKNFPRRKFRTLLNLRDSSWTRHGKIEEKLKLLILKYSDNAKQLEIFYIRYPNKRIIDNLSKFLCNYYEKRKLLLKANKNRQKQLVKKSLNKADWRKTFAMLRTKPLALITTLHPCKFFHFLF